MSRYNPCGRVVDIGHTEYVTRWKPYPDSDLTEEILWYQARDDAPLLGTVSANLNLVWDIDRDEYLETVVGEVPGSRWSVVRTPPHLLALGTHVCGTPADFAGAGSYPGGAPVVLRPDGLPICCGQLFQGAGGIGLGSPAAMADANPVLAQVVSSGGDPPVHVCLRMTRNTSNNVVEFSPATTFSQVLNPDECAWPDGALIELYEIADWPGWYWGEPIIQYADSQTISLALDTSTDVLTADAITQLSVTQDASGIKLVGDSTPPAYQYYGTPSGGTSRGYQSFTSGVQTAAGTSSVITAFVSAIFGTLPQNNFQLIAAGGGVFFVGLNSTVASTTTELLDNVTALSVNGSAQLEFSAESTIYTNDFNSDGLLINRTAGAPSTATDTITISGGAAIDVTSSVGAQTITIAAVYQMSITADLSGLKFVNDQAAPGASYIYSTDSSGVKGWHVSDGVWIEIESGTWSHIGPQTTGGTTVAWPSSLTYDAKGHVSAATAGGTPVTSISTLDGTGGPISGGVTLEGAGTVTLSVSGSTVIITGAAGGPYGPAPTTAPTLTATPGNAQVSLSWTTSTGATTYQLQRGSTVVFTGSGTSFVDTGLTNGTLYHYTVNGEFNDLLGPSGTASATPVAPPTSGVRAFTSATTFTGTTGFSTPSAAVAGDILVVGLLGALTGYTAPGWSVWTIGGTSQGNGVSGMTTYTKTAVGGAETFVLSGSGSTSTFGAVCLDIGKTSRDFSSDAGNNGGTQSTTITAGSVSATSASDVGMCWYCADGATTITVPSTLAAIAQASDGTRGTICVGALQLVASGTFTPGSATNSTNAYNDSITATVK